MSKTETAVRAILSNWTDVHFTDHGPFEAFGGVDPYGTARGGHSLIRDAEDVARDLVQQSQPVVQVEAPGLPDDSEWQEGEMPDNRQVRWKELDYELRPADQDAHAATPLPEPTGMDAADDGGGLVAERVADVEGGVAADIVEPAEYAPSVFVAGQHTLDERKNELSLAIDDACEDRIEAQAPIGYAAELAALRAHQQGAKEKALPDLTDEQHARLAYLEGIDNWINGMRAYGAATRRALRAWDLAELDAFDVAAADWPRLG